MVVRHYADLSFNLNGHSIQRPSLCFYHAVKAAMLSCPVSEELDLGIATAKCAICDGYRVVSCETDTTIEGNEIMQKIRKIVQATGA